MFDTDKIINDDAIARIVRGKNAGEAWAVEIYNIIMKIKD